MDYRFGFTLNDSDYYEFTKYYNRTSPLRRKSKRNFILIYLAIGIMLFIVNIMQDTNWGSLSLYGTIYLVVVAFLILAGTGLFRGIVMRANIKAMKKHGKLPYPKNVQMVFNNEFMIAETETGSASVKYAAIDKIAKETGAIYIYTGAASAYIVPYSVFESEIQQAEFLLKLNRCCGKIH